VIRRLALTVSDVSLKLVCFQSTNTGLQRSVSITLYALYKFTNYLLTKFLIGYI